MFVLSELCFLSRCLLSHPPGVSVHRCMVCSFLVIHCNFEFIKTVGAGQYPLWSCLRPCPHNGEWNVLCTKLHSAVDNPC